jgi:hypothetical protein
MCSAIRLVCTALVTIWATPIQAHDIYANLRNSEGGSCCNENDCRPALYRKGRFGVDMFVQNRWIAIPPSAIQYRFLDGDTGETNGGHWCGSHAHYEDVLFTYCAVLPPHAAFAAPGR